MTVHSYKVKNSWKWKYLV